MNQEQELTTLAERSGWTDTGRYDEVERLSAEFQRRFPNEVKTTVFGVTSAGREMLALTLSADGILAPNNASAVQRPVVLFQGGIHSGEIDGKDAGFLLMKDLLLGKLPRSLLEHVTLVFVPVLNIDGHERVSKYNRPNQCGPIHTGFRTTALNLNLNRDYTKADSPEMQSILRLLNEWDPIVYGDFHVTDGAKFAHNIAFVIHPTRKGPERLRGSALDLQTHVIEQLSTRGHLPLSYYPEFATRDRPDSGIKDDMLPPRYSHAYWGERNRIGVLIETHSWKDYATRIDATYASMVAILDKAAQDGTQWKTNAAQADAADAKHRNDSIVLTYEPSKTGRVIEFQGCEYQQELSAVSGSLKIKYFPTKPQLWKFPFYDDLQPAVVIEPPKKGYYVPAAHAWLGDKLRLHRVNFESQQISSKMEVQVFRADSFETGKETSEGRTTLKVAGKWVTEKREIAKGSLFVPVAQDRFRIILHLLEPMAPDSFLQWGFFNAHYERKEYMENYLAEEIAEELLAKDETVRKRFQQLLQDDESFAADPQRRLDFFYRLHPSWDDQFALYPIFRV